MLALPGVAVGQLGPEDDVVVTADGMDNLSAALPRDPDEIEQWMAELRG